MPKPSQPATPPPPVAPPAPWWQRYWPDALNLGVLAVLMAYLAGVSWRKWPHPLIDFGREPYLAWRLSMGDLLYRDVDHLYGPFSPYFNSLVFRVFGVSMINMFKANLVILTVIVGLMYFLVRAGWGRWAALVGTAVFVAVFSFSHLVGIGNYNFISPYSTEMTHGFLLILVLVAVLRVALRRLAAGWVFGAGLLCGLAVLIKPEIMLAAGGVMAGAVALLAWRDFRKPPWARWGRAAAIFVAGGFVPMLLATLLFCLGGHVSLHDALAYSNNAWLGIFDHSNMASSEWQQRVMGTDHLWKNLWREFMWGGMAVAFGGGLALALQGLLKLGTTQKVVGLVFLIAAVAFLVRYIPWSTGGGNNLYADMHQLPREDERLPDTLSGFALPGLLLCGLLIEGWRLKNQADSAAQSVVRVLMILGAAAFLARMAFDPHIQHYGFVQAALAGVVGVATLLTALPEFFRLEGPARCWHCALISVVMLGGAYTVARDSGHMYAEQDYMVGANPVFSADGKTLQMDAHGQPLTTEGPDTFFYFDPVHIDPTGELVQIALDYLAADKTAHSLVVLPEGIMINYLARLPDSTPQYFFDNAMLEDGRDVLTRQKLIKSPPDRIIEISRDLSEYIGPNARYGDSPAHGSSIVAFVNDNYDLVGKMGNDDPFTPGKFGLRIYKRKAHGAADLPDLPP